VAAEPTGAPVRRAAPWPAAVRGAPLQGAAQDEP
jgi:hypothetical protein